MLKPEDPKASPLARCLAKDARAGRGWGGGRDLNSSGSHNVSLCRSDASRPGCAVKEMGLHRSRALRAAVKEPSQRSRALRESFSEWVCQVSQMGGHLPSQALGRALLSSRAAFSP